MHRTAETREEQSVTWERNRGSHNDGNKEKKEDSMTNDEFMYSSEKYTNCGSTSRQFEEDT